MLYSQESIELLPYAPCYSIQKNASASSYLASLFYVELLAGGKEDAEAGEEDEDCRLQAKLCKQNQSLISC